MNSGASLAPPPGHAHVTGQAEELAARLVSCMTISSLLRIQILVEQLELRNLTTGFYSAW